MRKKLLFMLINMNIGGTEKALLNLIDEFPREQYEITIFMLEEYGGFLGCIPPDVNVKYFNGYQNMKDLLNKPPQAMALQLLRKGRAMKAMAVLFLHIFTKILGNRSLFFRYILRKYPVLEEEYDAAVAFDGPMDFISYFVLKKIKAKKKFQWIHFDVEKIGFNPRFALRVYGQFDAVFAVSNGAKNKLLGQVPLLKEKTDIFPNIASSRVISRQSKEGAGFTDRFDGLRILTVGRLSSEKGQDLAIQACLRLAEDGFNIRWYCLGEGPAREQYERLIEEYNLKDKFILLGADPNPYPYMDQCDIYVQPSRHEGYCITLAEAKCLGKPIVATDFTGAREQIKSGETGLIVDIQEVEIYHALVKLIQNSDLRQTFSLQLFNENLAKKSGTSKLLMIG